MSMEGLRQGAQNIRTGSGKGPQRSSYYARWKPPQMNKILERFLAAPPNDESVLQVSEPVVLIPGSYPDFLARDEHGSPILGSDGLPIRSDAYRFKAHNFSVFIAPSKPGQKGFQAFREVVCSAGYEPHAPQPCLGCYQVDHGQKDSKPRDQWAFNIAHLNWYHKHPIVKDGQVQMKKGTNDPVLVKSECLGYKMENAVAARIQDQNTKAQLSRSYKPCEQCGQQSQFIFGDHRTIQVGFGHLKTFLELDDTLGKKCANCGTHLLLDYFNCGNEQCDAPLVDIAASRWTNDQIAQYSKTGVLPGNSGPQPCSRCGFTGLPYASYRCGFDENFRPTSGGCAAGVVPKKTQVFDCVLWLQREGEKTETEIVVKRVELISQYKTHDGRSLDEHLKEIVPAPFNLAEMYSPDTLDEQAETLRMPNPYTQAQQQFTPYGNTGGYNINQGVVTPGVPPMGVAQPGQPMYPNAPMPGRPNFGK